MLESWDIGLYLLIGLMSPALNTGTILRIFHASGITANLGDIISKWHSGSHRTEAQVWRTLGEKYFFSVQKQKNLINFRQCNRNSFEVFLVCRHWYVYVSGIIDVVLDLIIFLMYLNILLLSLWFEIANFLTKYDS